MKGGQAWSVLMRSAPKATALTGAALSGTAFSKEQTACESRKLQKRMSSVGQLSVLAETKENPQNPTLLVALTGKPFGKDDFEHLWRKREMASQHPRFHQRVVDSAASPRIGVLEPASQKLDAHVKERSSPQIYNLDLQEWLQSCLQVPLNIQTKLWDVELSPGCNLGQSGAISKERAAQIAIQSAQNSNATPTESLVIFRGHEALADCVSLATAFLDLCDEAEDLKEELELETQKEKRMLKALTWWQKLARLLLSLYYSSIGTLRAFLRYWKMYWNTSMNPFQLMEMHEDTITEGKRTLSWAQLASIDELKQVAKSLTKQQEVTVNDIIISCVSAAVARQMQEHQMRYEMDATKPRNLPVPKTINAMIPLVDVGLILNHGQTLAHRMGSFFAPVPSDITSTAAERVVHVHDSLHQVHQVQMQFWNRMAVQFVSSFFPAKWATGLLQQMQPNAAFMVVQSEGPHRRINLDGREVEVLQGFMPLPPGVPIGVMVSTYAGQLSLSVTAEPWAVPDAERFLGWVLDEYKFLYTESPVALQSH